MRKTVSYLALTLCLTAPTLANGAFVIRLKNGNEYVTNRYWQEGAQVLFDADGGIFGVDKAFVHKIEKTDKVIKMVTTADHDPSEKTQVIADENNKEPAQETPATEAPAPVKDENDPIKKDVARLKDRVDNVAGMFPDDLRALSKELFDYKTKIQKDPKLFIERGREFNDLQQMGAAVDSALQNQR
ncbi:MAG: hypothetical protein EXR70_05900 [Deltaproteobacteria bacterium]|nr:hypothetical protein [Deltaproteobacteria bacterium]